MLSTPRWPASRPHPSDLTLSTIESAGCLCRISPSQTTAQWPRASWSDASGRQPAKGPRTRRPRRTACRALPPLHRQRCRSSLDATSFHTRWHLTPRRQAPIRSLAPSCHRCWAQAITPVPLQVPMWGRRSRRRQSCSARSSSSGWKTRCHRLVSAHLKKPAQHHRNRAQAQLEVSAPEEQLTLAFEQINALTVERWCVVPVLYAIRYGITWPARRAPSRIK
jgi:hypothetical protein